MFTRLLLWQKSSVCRWAFEARESLEQLRALENGMTIRAMLIDRLKLIEEAPADINTPEELSEALKYIK